MILDRAKVICLGIKLEQCILTLIWPL